MTDEQTRLDQTIPGGKYLAADGVTFVDAWGTPLPVQEKENDGPPSMDWTKAQLVEFASTLGIDNADKLGNKQVLLEAIAEKQSAPASQPTGTGDDNQPVDPNAVPPTNEPVITA